MAYEMMGIVTFQFSGVEIEGTDPYEAIHEVETMSVSELMNYADDVAEVQVLKQKVVQNS